MLLLRYSQLNSWAKIAIGDNGPTFRGHVVSKTCADDVRNCIWGQTHVVHALRLASLLFLAEFDRLMGQERIGEGFAKSFMDF